MEYKATPLDIKATSDEGVVEGYFSVFDNLDDGGDITHRGAFTKTLQERGHRVKVFFAHIWDRLIAPPPEVLKEDDTGLFARFKIILSTFWGREAWELIKHGAMTEGSYGYKAIKFDYGDNGQRHLRENMLLELSPVALGMNALTSIRAVKRALEGKPYPNEHACRLRDPGDFQVDSFRRVSRESGGKKYSIIMGRLKGEDTMTEQAYRYAKDTWDAAAARKHCNSHDGASFEAASGKGRDIMWPPALAVCDPDFQIAQLAAFVERIKEGGALVTADPDRVREALGALDALVSEFKEHCASTAAEPVIDHSPLLVARYRMAELAMHRLVN